MTSPDTRREEKVVVVDLGSLELRSDRSSVTATLVSTGEFLATRATQPAESPRAATARLLEDVLATTRLWRDGGWRRVVLYNPYTARMAIDATTGAVTLWAGQPIKISPEGTLGDLVGSNLSVGGRVASPEDPDMTSVCSTLAAHSI